MTIREIIKQLKTAVERAEASALAEGYDRNSPFVIGALECEIRLAVEDLEHIQRGPERL